MAGVLFVVCVPTSHYEVNLTENSQGKSLSSKTISEDFIRQFSDSKSQSFPNLRKNISTTRESLCATDDTGISYVSRTPKEYSTLTISTDGNEDRNSYTESRVNQRIYRSYEPADKPEGSIRNEDLPRDTTKKGIADGTEVQTGQTMPMEKILEMVLKKLKIENAVWCSGESGQYYQVLFTVGSGDCCEEILRHLSESGIGMKLNSVVSVIPCTLHYEGKQQPLVEECPSQEQTDECKQKSAKQSAWDKFLLSVRARLTVAQVVEGVRADSNLTFDFLALLVTAGIVAALGLAENSTIVLVASMLISPLMVIIALNTGIRFTFSSACVLMYLHPKGPILAGTFGTVIADRHLQKIGVLNELFGLLVCLVVGFIFGLAAGLVNEHWGNGGWPTDEMIARGQLRSLWVGLLVAIPSGAAVAIGILVDNTASLVGVAISASLLPPAVNAGLFWALACMDILWQGRMRLEDEDADPANTYTPIYSDNPRIELFVLGAVSLCLTLVNIISIFLAGIIVLKIKEVAPRTSKDEMQFWKHDIKVTRDYNRTFHGEDAEKIRKRLAEEIARAKIKSSNVISLGHHNPLLAAHEVFKHAETSDAQHQLTWSPSTAGFNQDTRPTLQDLHNMYTSISTARGQGAVAVQPFPYKRRRLSLGIFCVGGSDMNSIAVLPQTMDLSSSTTIPLPTITESNLPYLRGSDTSTVHTSSEGQPSSRKKIFTVTRAADPALNL